MPTKKKTAKKAASKKAATTKAPVKKTTATKAPVKKAAAKAPVKKAATTKAPVKKAATKAPAKKAAVSKKVATAKAPAKKAALTKVNEEANINVQPLYGDAYKLKKGEEYMNPDQVKHFRAILNMWKADLMQEVDRTVHHMQDEAANFPDPNDRASQETEFALELRARDRERKLIKKIDESIDMLNHNDYGYCELCGVEIGVRRLEARPTANLCIDCKTLDEIREKQMG